MGIFDGIKKKVNNYGESKEFLDIISALDNDEEWAKNVVADMWVNPEPNLLQRIDNARIIIHEPGALQGNPKDMYYYGISVSDFSIKMRMLLPLAEKGNVDAMTAIAREYSLGELSQCGTPENEDESFKWYLKAAELGDVSSQIQVALHYKIERNYEEAFGWYVKAARQDSAKGYCGMADYYEFLYLSSSNADERIELLEKMLDCYDAGYEYVASDDEEVEVASGLAKTYESASAYLDAEKAQFYHKLAIFYYWVAYDCGNPYQFERAREIAEREHISVDFSNMIHWAKSEGIVT